MTSKSREQTPLLRASSSSSAAAAAARPPPTAAAPPPPHPHHHALHPDSYTTTGTPFNVNPVRTTSYLDDDATTASSVVAAAGVPDLDRRLSLLDLICIGVGGTVGSGIFQLAGLIARDYAGPSTFLSWAVGGLAASLSGVCCAELGGKIPLAGSAYAYASVTIGEFAAFLAAACLSLIYIGTASAVARSWGDKVYVWVEAELSEEDGGYGGGYEWVLAVLEPGMGVSTMAFLVSTVSVALLIRGVEESKNVANFFTALKVSLVVFMIVVGATLTDTANLTPLIPPEFGMAGVFRGATSSFFGYIGFDEACMLAGEAKNPRKNMPRAVLGTIGVVTALYMMAALVLTGMQPYSLISSESGFPDAFRYNGVDWAARISAAGELTVLPIVVLISLMAQPRLQWALARDGLLPPAFAEVDDRGNLRKGALYSGVVMVAVATLVPFSFLDDVLSAAQLVAFCVTNWSVVALRYSSSPEPSLLTGGVDGGVSYPDGLDGRMFLFNALSMASGLVARHRMDSAAGWWTFCFLSALLVWLLCSISALPRGGGGDSDDDDGAAIVGGGGGVTGGLEGVDDDHGAGGGGGCGGGGGGGGGGGAYYEAPLVPLLPCLGIYVNWYLVAQLEASGILLLLAFLGASSGFYLTYGVRHSLGHKRRRRHKGEARIDRLSRFFMSAEGSFRGWR